MNSKILASMIVIAIVSLSAVAGTFATFSDTETSKDNVFTAGVIDLKIDADVLVDGTNTVLFPEQDDGALTHDDREDSLPVFFNYSDIPGNDIKPGDSGEVTISLHLVDSNDAKLSMKVLNVVDDGNGVTEPEAEQEAETGVDDAISEEIIVKLWLDDGNNVMDGDECAFYTGSLHDLNLHSVVLVEHAVNCETYYVGFEWCLPSTVGNEHQSDRVTFDLLFMADQLCDNCI